MCNDEPLLEPKIVLPFKFHFLHMILYRTPVQSMSGFSATSFQIIGILSLNLSTPTLQGLKG